MARGPVVNVTVTGDSKGAQTAIGDLANKIPGLSGIMGKLAAGAGDVGATLGAALPGAAAAGAAALAAFAAKSVASFAEQAQEVLHFKEVSGLAAEEASKFVAVADDYAVSAEALSTAIGKMNKTAGDTPEKLKAVGVEIGKTSQGAYDSEKTFLNVVDAYNATNDASEKARIGAAAFGKGWQSVVRILDQGSGKLKADFAAVKGFQIFNDEDLNKAEAWRHAMDDLGDAIKGIERELGEKLIPVLTEVANRLTNLAERAAKPDGGGGWFGFLIKGVEEVGKAVAEHFAPMVYVLNELTKETGTEHIVSQAEAIAEAIPKATAAAEDLRLEVQKVDDATTYGASNEGYRKWLNEQADAADKARVALQKYFDQTVIVQGGELGVERAINNVTDTWDAYLDKAADVYKAKGTDIQANKDLRDAEIDHKQSIIDVGKATYDLAAAKATQSGATDVATQATAAERLALIATLQKMAPNDPDRQWLQKYIDDLYNIPSKVDTTITLNTSGVLPGQAGQRIGKYAEGGLVPGLKGEPQLAIVHGGEYVVSNAMQARATTSPTVGADGGTVNNNVTINVNGGDPKQIVAVLKQYTQQNGPGWMN